MRASPQYCYAVKKGTSNMWLATSEQAPAAVQYDWLDSGLMVFQGELMCCKLKHTFACESSTECDWQRLIKPILGFYGELFAQQLRDDVQSPCSDQGGPAADYATAGALPTGNLLVRCPPRPAVRARPPNWHVARAPLTGAPSRPVRTPPHLGCAPNACPLWPV
jgi:hypothetical protein